MKRDLIPIYGIFSSGWRWLKESYSYLTSPINEIEGVTRGKGLRMFSRLLESGVVGVYNAGIAVMAETLYTMLKN